MEQRIAQAINQADRVLNELSSQASALADSQGNTPLTSASGTAATTAGAGTEPEAGGGMPRSASQSLNSAGAGRASGVPRAASLGRFASPAKPLAAAGEGCSSAKKVGGAPPPACPPRLPLVVVWLH